jgi:4-alpha-glucanotransferase
MDRNSVDVWWNRRLFKLDANGEPLAVAGVPPDYFNEDGQLWGNPLYEWEQMRKEGFEWWRARLRFQLSRFDLLRIDHFRALESYWEVPIGAKSAREGSWQRGCGHDLLTALEARFDNLALVAEDLGMVDDAVYALRDEFGLPGMAVVQFAFDGLAHNPHLPKNHRENSVVYTGTHDNDTLVGWYAGLDEAMCRRIVDELDADGHGMPEYIIDVVYQSRARLAILPMQDLLGLGSEARMNTPGKAEGNWSWRFAWDAVDPAVAAKAKKRAVASDRLTS